MKALIGVELLRKLPPGPVEIHDTKLPGFVLRVRASGTHTYYAQYGRGRRVRIGTVAALTPPEAREQARTVLGDVMKGGDPVAARRAARTQITFDAFLTDHYEPWAVAQRKTGAEQVQRLRTAFKAIVAGKHLHEIGAFDVERWRSARLTAGATPATVNRDLNVLRGALSRAVDWNLLPTHPLAKVKAARIDRRPIARYLTPDEETRLAAALTARDDTRRAERARANDWRRERGYAIWPAYGLYTDHLTPLVTLALHTGLRRGELFQLRWRDIDALRHVVTVGGGGAKSGQTRHVPLNTTAAAALATWRTITNPGTLDVVVFEGTDGAPLEDIKKAWGALLRRAAITAFRFHDCRHHFASKLVMAGIDLNTVRELLGHSDIKMVLRYAHLAPEHLAAAVARLVVAS